MSEAVILELSDVGSVPFNHLVVLLDEESDLFDGGFFELGDLSSEEVVFGVELLVGLVERSILLE